MKVLHVSNGPGSPASAFQTIQAAADVAQPGDTIWVHPGVYREWVQPVRGGEEDAPITFSAKPGTVFVRGSELLEGHWEATATPGVYRHAIMPEWVRSENPFALPLRDVYLARTRGQIFVEGELWPSAGSLEDVLVRPGTWFPVDEGQAVLVHLGPQGPDERLIEATVRRRVFSPLHRGIGYLTVRGFVFEHGANDSAGAFWREEGSQQGIVGFRTGHHFVFEENTVRFAQTIGLDFGFEGGRIEREEPYEGRSSDHLIQNNRFVDNGECGICGLMSHRVRILGNRIERNNSNSMRSIEDAGLKTHFLYDGLIEGNYVCDNESAGIWLDNVWRGSRVTRNVVLNNVGNGIFIEMGSDDGMVDHNIVGYTRAGDGIYLHDSSDVTIAHNLLVQNGHFGVYIRRVAERLVERAEGPATPVEASRNRVWGNLFVDNFRGHICMPGVAPLSEDNTCDENLFLNGTQWQWEGLGFHRFVVNGNDGRIPDSELYRRYREAVGPDAEVLSEERWIEQPYLSLDEWRAMTGFDKNSVAPTASRITGNEIGFVTKGTLQLATKAGTLYLSIKGEEALLRVKRDAAFGTDFWGKPRGETTMAGPFDKLEVGANTFQLWPLPRR